MVEMIRMFLAKYNDAIECVRSTTRYNDTSTHPKPQNHYNMLIIWELGERQNDEN